MTRGREIISETVVWEVAEPRWQFMHRQCMFAVHCTLLEVQEEGWCG